MFIIVTLLLCLISLLYIKTSNKNRSLKLPPSPPSLPLLGHLHLNGYETLQNLSTKYGPIMHLRYGSTTAIHISSAFLLHEVFKTQDVNFASRPVYALDERYITFGVLGIAAAPDGVYWRFMKKLLVTELLGNRQLNRSRSIRKEEIERFLTKLIDKAQRNEVVDVRKETVNFANNIICRMMMSTRCSNEDDDEAKRIRDMIEETFKKIGGDLIAGSLGPLKKLGLWLYNMVMADLNRGFHDLLDSLIKEHEEKSKKDDDKDILDVLLDVLEDDKAEVKITKNHVKAVILDLLLPGTKASSDAMQWALAELINNPHIFKKAREEIESVVGSRLVEESDIKKLPYLQAVIKETLRLHPPNPIVVRETFEQSTINGFDIPAKSVVLINVYAIMRDPKHWKIPQEFCPERFLETDDKTDDIDHVKGQNFNFIPFGGGRRLCPAENLANMTINVAIANMIRCIDWKVKDGVKVNMEAYVGAVMPMVHALQCVPVVHFNPFSC